MAQGNDQVFQLSLTEIAFTIAFILLLLLGYLVVKEQTERIAAEAALAKVQSTEQTTAALEAAKNTLVETLRGAGAANPDEVITKLVAVEDVRAERDRLKKRVDDLDAKLTALEELQKQLEKAAQAERPDIAREEISAALVLQEQVRKALEDAEAPPPTTERTALQPAGKAPEPASGASAQSPTPSESSEAKQSRPTTPPTRPDAIPKSVKAQRSRDALEKVKQAIAATGELRTQLKAQLNRDLPSGKESQTVRDVVTAARGYAELATSGINPEQIRKENSDLRGQVAFLKNRLDARGGRDYPPCWADESGKVEFVFSVEVRPDSVVVSPAWPPRREAAARALPGMADVLAGAHSNTAFVSRIQGIFNWSKSQDPECRHYVQLRSSISDAVQSDRARLMVENYFYKSEVRR